MGFSAWIPAFPANLGLANRQRSRRNVVHQVARERLGGECCKPVDKNFLKIIAVIFYGKFGQGVLAWRAGRRNAHVSAIAGRRLTVKPVNT